MKTLVKLVSVLMIAVLAFGMIGCNKADEVDIKELKQHKGNMLVITAYPQGPMTEEEYNMRVSSIRLDYPGTAYIPNPIEEQQISMPDDEYLKIYNFCKKAVAENKFANYSEQVCDGTTYKFVYFDTEGHEHVLYDGYCYENKELRNIISLITKYQID